MVKIQREATQNYVVQNLSSEFGESSSPSIIGHYHINVTRILPHNSFVRVIFKSQTDIPPTPK